MVHKVTFPKYSFSDYLMLFNGFFPKKPTFTEKDYPSLDGKVVIITGANSGVGYQSAKSLLGSTNARVYMFARNPTKAEQAIKKLEVEVAQEYKKTNLDIHFIQIDFSDLTTIKPAAEKFLSQENRLDIIIHNAGVMTPPAGSRTKQNFDLELGTNNLGSQLLQKYLDPILIKTSITNKPGESRIVWVASTASYLSPIGGIHYADPNFNDSDATKETIYGQSKAVNVLQAKGWNGAHPDAKNVVCVSICPGYLRTELQKYATGFEALIYRLFFHDARNGAYTELFAALSPKLTMQNTGAYVISFGHISKARKDLDDPENIRKAWNFLEEELKPYI
ncbi:short-chain alcohol dehydrogenase [Scheffersomyces amazonensis]|uniref:short-chain alcohol dehydrogenase n=1 Tax=Scheffersomyces amazonensis TaxID=1078765 RepID=UPI00315D1311